MGMIVEAQKLGTAPLMVGTIELPGRAFLAPMSGITDVGMRRIASRFGAGLVISEMVASDSYVKGEAEASLRAEGKGLDLHVVQLAGRDPRWMGEAARLAEANGAAIIDINMGCPAKRVTGGYAGSALMRDLDLALRLIDATIAAVKVPVTLKTRLGWDPSCLNACELAARAEASGVQLITIHGRTRRQFYKGRADWAAIRAIKSSVSVPVVANGDCGGLEDARAMLTQSGADAVMIGRAAVGRPWLIGDVCHGLEKDEIRTPLRPDVMREAALEHYESLLAQFGPRSGVRHARKHLAAYADTCGWTDVRPERLELLTTDDPRRASRLLFTMFDDFELQQAA